MKTISKVVIYYTDGTYEEVIKSYPYLPLNPAPWPPTTYPSPDPSYMQPSSCRVCGMKFDGPMGYVCSRPDCPSGVTCSNES